MKAHPLLQCYMHVRCHGTGFSPRGDFSPQARGTSRQELGALALRSLATCMVFACCVAATGIATAAPWSFVHGDGAHRGVGLTPSDIDVPGVAWSFLTGGGFADSGMALCVTGTESSIITSRGGRLSAHDAATGALVWDTAPVGLTQVIGPADVDGDGIDELIAAGSGILAVIDGLTGRTLWSSDAHENASVGLGVVYAIDVDGDRAAEIYYSDAGGGSGGVGTGWLYDFAAWPLSAAVSFHTQPEVEDYSRGTYHTLAQLDDDAGLEVLVPGNRRLYAYDLGSGEVEYEVALDSPIPWGEAPNQPIDLDNDGRQEVVMWTNNLRASAPDTSQSLTVVEVDRGTLAVRWTYSVAVLGQDRHRFVGDSVADVDGDGDVELVTSFWTQDPGEWRILVFDGQAGLPEILASLAGRFLEGVVDLDGDGVAEILGRASVEREPHAFGRLEAFDLTHEGVQELFSIEHASVLQTSGVDAALGYHGPARPIRLDACVAVLVDSDDDLVPDELQTISGRAGAPCATFALPGVVEQVTGGRTTPSGGLLLSLTTGHVISLTRNLLVTNPAPDGQASNLQLGSFLSEVRVGNGITGPVICAETSAGMLEFYDGPGVAIAGLPTGRSLSGRSRSVSAFIDINADGADEIVAYDSTDETAPAVEAYSLSSGTLWSAPLGVGQRPGFSLGAADFNDDGTLDVVVQASDPSTAETWYQVVDGTDGAFLWPAEDRSSNSGGAHGQLTIDDADGDGRPDVLVTSRRTIRVVDGTDGTLEAETTMPGQLGSLTLIELLGDAPGPQYLWTGGTRGPALYARDLVEVWARPFEGELYQQFGPVLDVRGTPVLAFPFRNTSRVVFMDPSSGADRFSRLYAGGDSFDSLEDARDAGRTILGSSDMAGLTDLDGSGTPAFLFGTEDGYLLALRAEDGGIAWALPFPAAVGAPVPADFDSDGTAEILVPLADGRVVLVDRGIQAPAWVYDNAGEPVLRPEEDIDETESQEALFANWATVSGAVGYEVTALTEHGGELAAWTDVGAVSQAEVNGLSLVPGNTYLFAVRAYGQGALVRSAVTVSDGVTVVDRTAPVGSVWASPDPFSPDGDGTDDTTTINVEVEDSGFVQSWEVLVLAPEGVAVRTYGPVSVRALSVRAAVQWDGLNDDGTPHTDGIYGLRLVAHDISDNESVATGTVEVRTAGETPSPDEDDGGLTMEEDAESVTAERAAPTYFARGGGCSCRAVRPIRSREARSLAAKLATLLVAVVRRERANDRPR